MSHAHEPISRLSLERFQLGELSVEKAEQIEAHLLDCAACRRSLDFIKRDARALPLLRERIAYAKTRNDLFGLRRFSYVWIAAAAIVWTGLFFTLTIPDRPSPDRNQDAVLQVKGQDTSMYIVRNRNGLSTENPNAFEEGDTFKIFVTYLGEAGASWDLAVFQGEQVYFPLTPEAPLSPGSRVPLPKALVLDGNDPVDICVFIGDVPSRTQLTEGKRSLESRAAACKTLSPSETQP